ATVGATLGAVTAAHAYRGRVLRTDLRVGDPSFDNSNFEGGARVETVPLEDDYAALRRELWLRTDEAYKSALETLARKRAAGPEGRGGRRSGRRRGRRVGGRFFQGGRRPPGGPLRGWPDRSRGAARDG